ncbi:MAG: NAD(P)H-dependent glycerol-3-phosphate dehydrogenase [Candidatus Omnitrophota bacterium]
MKTEIAVIGDGGWGTTVAILLANKGYDVTLWGAFPDYIALLKKERINHKFLPGIKIPEKVRLTQDAGDIKKNAIAVIAIPSKYLRQTITGFKGRIGEKAVSLTKGIEEDTLKRPSEVISDVLGPLKIAAVSGPTISFEVARNLPTTVVAASGDEAFAGEVQNIFTTPSFRAYTSGDITGVELGGALKNIIAIAAGISDGMGLGVNAKAALLTRGLAEIIRLGVKMGARKETFFGLSGLGDLATTCMSSHSRNRWLGEEIAKGKNLKDVLKETEMIVEGVTTTKSAYEMSKKIGVEIPITQKIYELLYHGKKPKDAVRELMTRALKSEDL